MVCNKFKIPRAKKLIFNCLSKIGCPAGLYLAGAGIGHIGIVDYDEVEITNLHRQLLHTEKSIGTPKSTSAKNTLAQLNSSIEVTVHHIQLNSLNALNVIKNYDIVLDATDNVATRYLLNDACVMLKKPLVSGSALQFEGQLTIYNYSGGACYRCIFPKPPPPSAVTNCGDGGVIGAVPGVIGTLQALEAIKIVLKIDGVLTGRLLLFDGARAIFRTVKLRGKRNDCAVCSDLPIITRLIDYEEFCGLRASDKDLSLNILKPHQRISVQEYRQLVLENEPHMLIDVRSPHEFEICQLDNAINVPIKTFLNDKSNNPEGESLIERIKMANVPVFLICRRGNDSQIAAERLQQNLNRSEISVKDIVGGLHSWSARIDTNFPVY